MGVVGRPRKEFQSAHTRKSFCGDEANDILDQVLLSYPVQNGIIEDFEKFHLLLEYTLHERLHVDPEGRSILMTEPPHNPKSNREELVEMMFETFGFESIKIEIQGVLALYGSATDTGLVLDSGHGCTTTMPVYRGYGLNSCINRLDVGGHDLNALMAKLLALEGTSLVTTWEKNEVRKIKERHCYVSLDGERECAKDLSCKLPDGREVQIDDAQWMCPEALFKPSIAGYSESMGVGQLVYNSINRCEIDMRTTLLSSVILSGGSTMFRNFPERLTEELRTFSPPSCRPSIKVITGREKDRTLSVWRGAQVLAQHMDLKGDQWMTADDFEEWGPSLIHNKMSIRYE